MAKTYHIPYVIISEERKIGLLNKRMQEYKKSCMIGCATLAIGVFFLIISYVWIGMLFGLAISIVSARVILRYLFNLGYEWTEALMRKRNKQSIVMQIRACEDTIEQLNKEAKELERKELTRRRAEEEEQKRVAEQGEIAEDAWTPECDERPEQDRLIKSVTVIEQEQSDTAERDEKADQDGTLEPDSASVPSDIPELDMIEEKFAL